MAGTDSKNGVLALCLMGPPGSGKGTQAVRLSKAFGIDHLSTGDLLRQEIKTGSDLGRQAEQLINEGQLVPDDIVNEMIHQRLEALVSQGSGFLLDGYPRTVDQLDYLLRTVEGLGTRISGFFFLDATADRLIERLMARMVCGQCGAVYNAVSKPPKNDEHCDLCNGMVIFRGDDNRESIIKRFEVYSHQTEPVLAAIEENQALIRVPADGQPQAIYDELEQQVRGMVAQ